MPTKRAASAIAEPEAPETSEGAANIPDPASAASGDGEEGAPAEESSGAVAAETFTPQVRLIGAELLEAVEGWRGAGRTIAEMAYLAGYYTVTKDGQERVLKAAFNNAFLEAQGFATGGSGSSRAHGNDGRNFARVSAGGQLLVSQLATREVKAVPGAVFSVEYPEPGVITLRLTDEVRPVMPRKKAGEAAEQPGTPLLDGGQGAYGSPAAEGSPAE